MFSGRNKEVYHILLFLNLPPKFCDKETVLVICQHKCTEELIQFLQDFGVENSSFAGNFSGYCLFAFRVTLFSCILLCVGSQLKAEI